MLSFLSVQLFADGYPLRIEVSLLVRALGSLVMPVHREPINAERSPRPGTEGHTEQIKGETRGRRPLAARAPSRGLGSPHTRSFAAPWRRRLPQEQYSSDSKFLVQPSGLLLASGECLDLR
jgi:hypothetical protein